MLVQLLILRIYVNSLSWLVFLVASAIAYPLYGIFILTYTGSVITVFLYDMKIFKYITDLIIFINTTYYLLIMLLINIPAFLSIILYYRKIKHIIKCNNCITTSCSTTNNFNKVKFLVIIPAHNEENVIQDILECMINQIYPSPWYRVLVVVDNCTDNTEEKVKEICKKDKYNYVDYVVRWNPNKRGKQYAVDYGIKKFKEVFPEFDPDYIIIIDADNLVPKKFLIECCKHINRLNNNYSFQTLILSKNIFVGKHDIHSIMSSFMSSIFLFTLVTNICFLGGTGMVIKYDHILRIKGYKAKTLVDDIEIQCKLVKESINIKNIPYTFVLDEKPTSIRDDIRRISRWMQGDIELLPILVRYIKNTIIRIDINIKYKINILLKLIAIMITFCIPPLLLIAVSPWIILLPIIAIAGITHTFTKCQIFLNIIMNDYILLVAYIMYLASVLFLQLHFLMYVMFNPKINTKSKIKLLPLTILCPEYLSLMSIMSIARAINNIIIGSKGWESTRHYISIKSPK